MNGKLRSLTVLLVAVAIVVAFWAGAATVTGSVPAAPQALTPAQWAAVQASNSLLLDQGPANLYLPMVLRH